MPARSRRRSPPAPVAAGAGGLEIAFRLDPSVLDGRFANNGWLQELPKPITKLTWDNAVIVSPATAEKLRARRTALGAGRRARPDRQRRRRAEISRPHRPRRDVRRCPDIRTTASPCTSDTAARAPATSATAPGSTPTRCERPTRSGSAAASRSCATGETYSLACTQYHHLMEGRGMVRAVDARRVPARSALHRCTKAARQRRRNAS